MLAPGTVLDIGDHSVEILGTPQDLGDRYLLRIEADPGGPGVKGDFPHIHPSLVESFKCVSGEMVVRLGKVVRPLEVDQKVEVPTGSVHGFLNTGEDQLIVESEVVFVNGYRPEDDLLGFASRYDQLKKAGPVGRSGEPPLLQMAVLTHEYRNVIVQPGLASVLMGPMAGLGKLMGYRADPRHPG